MAQSSARDDGMAAISNRRAPPQASRHSQPLAVDPSAVTRASGDPAAVVVMALALAMGSAGVRMARAGTWRTWLGAGSRVANRLRRPPSRRSEVQLRVSQWFVVLIYGLSLGLGFLALLYPFLTITLTALTGDGRAADAPLLLMVLVGLCFLALLSEVQERAVSAKIIALLGVLVAINSVLRFIEVGIPGPGGFTPIFFLIVLTGYVYGGRFGFLMGALTMLVSAVITGGVGPWLPGQMFTAGWMGLTAPLARPLVRMVGGAGGRREVLALAAFAGLWGLIYGVVINLWFWPFMAGPAEQYYQAGLGWIDTLRRYALFYLTTSLVWDVMAVVGNVTLVIAFGGPTLRALRRFQQRFEFSYRPWMAQNEA
jgi:energy-coupling factor transport system substrate-specific component